MIEDETAELTLSREQYAVFSCLSYFNIFSHPLRLNEVGEHLELELSHDRLANILAELLENGLIHTYENFYSTSPDLPRMIEKRARDEKRFADKRVTIKRFARFVSRFPYVESVSISGSCSKGLLPEDGDVDYFIIAKPGRLWLCRTILILFKKVFLLNSKKYFCLNYFIDSADLEIPDKNVFVASEITTLIPVNNVSLFERFLHANAWTREFLPNKRNYSRSFLIDEKHRTDFRWPGTGHVSKLVDRLDDFCFSLTYATWKRRYPHMRTEEFQLNFRSKKSVSKHHPRGFQNRVLAELEKNLENIRVPA